MMQKETLRRSAWGGLVLALLLCSGVSGCGILGPDDDDQEEPKAGDITVLFIGSSYLEFNNVPSRFGELARKAGKDVFVKGHTYLGQPLAFHASSFAATAVIREREWDYIVLQGGAHDGRLRTDAARHSGEGPGVVG